MILKPRTYIAILFIVGHLAGRCLLAQAPQYPIVSGGGGGAAQFSVNTGNILAYYRLFALTNCNTNAGVIPDSSGFSANPASVVGSSGMICDNTGWYHFTTTNYIALPASFTTRIAAIEVLFDSRGTDGNNAFLTGLPNPILGSDTNANPQVTAGYYAGTGQLGNHALASELGAGGSVLSSSYSTIPQGLHHLTYSMGGGDKFWIDGLRDQRNGRYGADSSAFTKTGNLYIGTDKTYNNYGKIAAVLLKTAAPTDGEVVSDMKLMMDDYRAAGGVVSRAFTYPDYTRFDTFFIIGDSICQYFASTTWNQLWGGTQDGNNTFGTINDPNPQGFITSSQACVSGQFINNTSDPLAQYRAIAPWASNFYNTLFVDMAAGTNNIAATGGSAVWDNFMPSIIKQVKDAGGILFVNTLMDRPSSIKASLAAYNARVRSECGPWDPSNKGALKCIVIDFGADPNLGYDNQNANATWFIDTTHPTQAGHNLMAQRSSHQVNSYWCTTRTNPSTTLTTGTTAQGDQDCFVPMNPAVSVTSTSTLPDAIPITNQIRRVACLASALGTCIVNTTSSQNILSAGVKVTSVTLTPGVQATFIAEYGSPEFPLNAASGWRRLPDNY